MANEEPRKTTAQLLAAIRPPEEEEEDRDEDQPEQEETEDEGEAEGDAPADEADAGEGEEPKPAAKGKDKPKPDAKTAADQYFSRQRKKAKDLAAELEAERARVARLERETAELRQRIDAGFAPKPEASTKDDVNPHDPEDRPVEHARWEAERARKEVEALRADMAKGEEQRQTLSQQQQQEQAVALYAEQVDAELNTAFQEVPGFGPMFAAYNGALIDHYIGQGMQRQAAVRQATLDHLRIAHVGSQRGMTPAEAIYQQAARVGFQPQAFASDVQETPQPKTKTAAPPAAPNLDGARAASRRAPRSINSAPGAGGRNARSVEALAGKRDKDWEKNDYKSLFSALRQKAGAY